MTIPSTYKLGYPPQKYSLVPMAGVYEADPSTSDIMNPKVGGYYPLGSVWVNKSTGGVWFLTNISGSTATWQGVTDPASGNVDGPASATDNALARFDGTTGKLIQNSIGVLTDAGVFTGITSMGIGIAPTAYLTLAAGTATAGTAPLKLTLGVNLTAPEAGAIEYDGTLLTYTDATLTRRALVAGPASTVDNTIPRFDSTTGKLLQTSLAVLDDLGVLTGVTGMGIGIAPTSYLTLAAGTATAGTAPLKLTLGVNLTAPEAGAIEYDGTLLTYTDNAAARNAVAVGPGTSTDNGIATWSSTTGYKLLSNTTTLSGDIITFPAGGGSVLTAGAGAAERKGTFTFDGSGTHTKILTTAAVTGCVIVYTIVTLGTVTAAQAILTTIDNGVGFTPVSAANNDSSEVNWAIVG